MQGFGLRPADDGAYSYYGIGIEHVAFEVDHPDEVDEAYGRCVAVGGKIQSPPERHYVEDGTGYYAFFVTQRVSGLSIASAPCSAAAEAMSRAFVSTQITRLDAERARTDKAPRLALVRRSVTGKHDERPTRTRLGRGDSGQDLAVVLMPGISLRPATKGLFRPGES